MANFEEAAGDEEPPIDGDDATILTGPLGQRAFFGLGRVSRHFYHVGAVARRHRHRSIAAGAA
ncbi:hypothetical protein ACFQU2_03930 [Siccirubricoccus deserti]